MRRVLAVLLATAVVLIGTGCGDDADDEATSSTSPTVAGATSTAGAAATTTGGGAAATTSAAPAMKAATAILEPDTVAGIELGTNKSAAIAVLWNPTTPGQETDVSGERYDFLRWELSGDRGLILNYRTQGATSPLLTDWTATAPGPVTARGIQVGAPESAVVAAYGPLSGFCCGVMIAEATRGPGRLIMIVEPGATVRQIIGGDPGFWSRSIAD